MKKLIYYIATLFVVVFTSCTDQEEIVIAYQTELKVRVDQLMSSFRQQEDGDFDINQYHSIRINSFIYDDSGTLIESFKNYQADYSSTSIFNLKLAKGKYTVITTADFVEGNSSPMNDSEVSGEFWKISNVSKISDLQITKNGVMPWFYETLGLIKTELTVTDRSLSQEILVKPITSLVYFHVNYIKDGQYLRAEKLEILGERVNDIVSYSENDWSYDCSFKIGYVTNFATIYPMESINNGYPGYRGYKAFLPTDNMRFWLRANVIANDGSSWQIDTSESNPISNFDYTDTHNFESDKEYLVYTELTDLAMSLSLFSTNRGLRFSNCSNWEKSNSYKIVELTK